MALAAILLTSVAGNSCVGPLCVPPDLAQTATPIWHSPIGMAEFVMARTEFVVANEIKHAVAFVTAQQSPFCQPDPRLDHNDYGACIPHGGSSQPRLLGAYKLLVNGKVVGMGPGRRFNQTQGVDAIDVSSVIVAKAANAIGLQGYHTKRFLPHEPRFLLRLDLVYADGTTESIATGKNWTTLNADPAFNPTGDSGAWARKGGFPHEFMDMRNYPTGWAQAGFADSSWLPALEVTAFSLPLGPKPGRAVEVFERRAVKISPIGGTDGATRYLVDFGKELQGGVNFTFGAATQAGHQVTVLLSEELRADGSALVPMHTGNNFTDLWTLRSGVQTVMQHEYMEFRYAEIRNPPSPPTLEDAKAWVIRYPLSDLPADRYGDVPMLGPSPSALRQPVALATFSSDNDDLNAVWELVRYTLVACGGLDVNVDSNTRQRDLCLTDAYITIAGQLALSSDYGVQSQTAQDAFQIDSNIWQGMTDFRGAAVALAHEHALYTGDLSLIAQRWADLQKHSFVNFFNSTQGLVVKSPALMGQKPACECPASWSPAGLPPGVYEATHCSCDDLIDWPAQYRDGYVSANNTASAVPNAYIALAADRMSQMARWLGKDADAAQYAHISTTILSSLRSKLYDAQRGSFADGLGIDHWSVQATLFAMMAGAVDDGNSGSPGQMGLAVVNALKNHSGRPALESCSCMAAFWLLEGLYRVGAAEGGAHAADFALSGVLTYAGAHSWLNMLKQGATCTMETWPAGLAPGSGGTGGTWSHPWCAGPNSVILRRLLGVKPIALGWSRFEFAPQPSTLGAINATVPITVAKTAAKATITVTLTQTAAALSAVLTVPDDTACHACLPPPHGQKVAPKLIIDGKPLADGEAVKEGRMLCTKADLGPGRHTVVRPAAG